MLSNYNQYRISFTLLIVALLTSSIYSQFTFSMEEPSIGFSNGQIIIELTGDADPYTITLSPLPVGQSDYTDASSGTYTYSNLPADMYTIVLADKLGCTISETVQLMGTDCPDFHFEVTNLMHNTGQDYPDGQITVEVISEIDESAYSIKWSRDNLSLDSYNDQLELQNLEKGEYKVEVILLENEDCVSNKEISILDCFSEDVLEAGECPGNVPEGEFCVVRNNNLPELDIRILEVTGVSADGVSDGQIVYSISGPENSSSIRWENNEWEKAFPINNVLTNLSAGEWCYSLESGCGDVLSGCVLIPVCIDAMYTVVIQTVDNGDNNQPNIATILIEKDGQTISDESLSLRFYKSGSLFSNREVSSFPYEFTTIQAGSYSMEVYGPCSESAIYVGSFSFDAACDEQISDVVFKGFKFNDDCGDGIFGGDGFRYEVEITDQDYLISNGTNFEVNWPSLSDPGPNQFQENFKIDVDPWNLSGEQKFRLFWRTAQPVTVVVSESNGCTYTVTRPVCEDELEANEAINNGGNGGTPIPPLPGCTDCTASQKCKPTGIGWDCVKIPLGEVSCFLSNLRLDGLASTSSQRCYKVDGSNPACTYDIYVTDCTGISCTPVLSLIGNKAEFCIECSTLSIYNSELLYVRVIGAGNTLSYAWDCSN